MQRRKFITAFVTLVLSMSFIQPISYAYGYDGTPPATYDLYAEGLVTPAKSQGPWSSCWAFGALSSIESNLVKKGYADDSVDLSERYLIWFATKPIDREVALKQPSALLHPEKHSQEGEGEYLLGSNQTDRFNLGQYDWVVASALSSGLALEGEDACPYQNRAGSLDRGTDASGKPISIPSGSGDWSVPGEREQDSIYRLKSAELIPGTSNYTVDEDTGALTFNGYREKNIDEVKRSLLDNGAVTISYAADTSEPNQAEDITTFNYDNWAQYRSEPKLADHTVSIIGWDDNYPKENFANASGKLPPKDGAWKIKNSWGRDNGGSHNTSSWGVNGEGWFYLSYYDKGIESFQTYDIEQMDSTPLDIMQYDFIGMNNFGLAPYMYDASDFPLLKAGSLPRVANVFEAPYNLEITEVSYAPHIENGKVDIQIYIQSPENTNPEEGLKVFSKTVSFKHAGYHTLKLDEPIVVAKGTTFSIVETVQGEYDDQKVVEIPIELGYDKKFLETTLDDEGPQAIYKAVVNPGESYVYINDWVDNTDLDTLEDFKVDGISYGNNLIKAFVQPTNKQAPDYEKEMKQAQIMHYVYYVVGAGVCGCGIYFIVKVVRKRDLAKAQKAEQDKQKDES